MQTHNVQDSGYATVGTRNLGQRMMRHRGLSDDRLEVEFGSKQRRERSEQAQGSVVGLF